VGVGGADASAEGADATSIGGTDAACIRGANDVGVGWERCYTFAGCASLARTSARQGDRGSMLGLGDA
jgi:hypothetical protein